MKPLTKEFVKLMTNKDLTDEQLKTFQSAFINPSIFDKYPEEYLEETLGTSQDYEFLEYLGDRVIKGSFGQYLYDQVISEKPKHKCTQKNVRWHELKSLKGLTNMNITMEQTKALSSCAKKLGFKRYAIYHGYVDHDSLLEDIFVVFVGEEYFHFGYKYDFRFVITVIEGYCNLNELITESQSNFNDRINVHYIRSHWGPAMYACVEAPTNDNDYSEYKSYLLCPVDIAKTGKKLFLHRNSYGGHNKHKVWLEQPVTNNRWTYMQKSGYIVSEGRGKRLVDAEQQAGKNALLFLGI